MTDFDFRPLELQDLPMLREWLARPHVAKWWDELVSLAEMEKDYAPAIADPRSLACYIVYRRDTPLGYIQSYVPVDFHAEGWWLDEHDPGVRGIDQFLADERHLDKGLGSAMVRAFITRLLADPAVTRIQTDPSPTNGRAIRAYEKAGFRPSGVVDTPDGRALVMYADRDSIVDP
jgi:aminoglycoside 6'-N-acetyltransferase Ib